MTGHEALLSLAAELEDTAEAVNDEVARRDSRAWLIGVAAGSGTEGCMLALRHAAQMARERAEQCAAEAGLAVVDPADLRWELGIETLTIMTAAKARAAHDRLMAVAVAAKP